MSRHAENAIYEKIWEKSPALAVAVMVGSGAIFYAIAGDKEKDCRQYCIVEQGAADYKFIADDPNLRKGSSYSRPTSSCDCISQARLDAEAAEQKMLSEYY